VNKIKRLLRVLRGVDIISKVELNCTTERHGSSYGGWTICPIGIDSHSIVYSIGVGNDISFDVSMIDKYELKIHAFDPTPRVVQWYNDNRLKVPDSFIFHTHGIENYDAEADFQPISTKHELRSSSHSTYAKPETKVFSVRVPMKTLETAMSELGHDKVDILKMDIEGSEWSVIPDIIDRNLEIYQILVEFHHLEFRNVGIKATKNCLRMLAQKQYKIFAISDSGQEYSFIRQDIFNRLSTAIPL
jgi:FkbM family methyltransferase